MSHVKTIDGYDVKVPSQGQVTLNSVLSALGTAGFVGLNLKDIVGGLFNKGAFNGMSMEAIMAMLIPMLTAMGCQRAAPACSDDEVVTRYDLAREQKIAEKDARIAQLEANIYENQKSLELYKYVDGQLKEVREFICEQKVRNQGVGDAVRELDKKIDYSIALEEERRKCADNSIVGYLNSTFAPKAVADYTAGTTSAVMQTRNPLCECNC